MSWKQFSNLVPCAMNSRPNGSHGHPERVSDFCVCQICKGEEEQGVAIVRLQRTQRGGKLGAPCLSINARVNRIRIRRTNIEVRTGMRFERTVLLAPVRLQQVRGYSEKPRFGRRTAGVVVLPAAKRNKEALGR